MWAAITSLISSVASGVLAPLFGYLNNKSNVDLQGFSAGVAADKDVAIAYIQQQEQNDALRASVNTWFGARLIVLIVAGSCAYHFSAVMFDSTPYFGHVVGSWHVPALPKPYDSYEGSVLLSFFILTPAAPVFNAVAAWFHHK